MDFDAKSPPRGEGESGEPGEQQKRDYLYRLLTLALDYSYSMTRKAPRGILRRYETVIIEVNNLLDRQKKLDNADITFVSITLFNGVTVPIELCIPLTEIKDLTKALYNPYNITCDEEGGATALYQGILDTHRIITTAMKARNWAREDVFHQLVVLTDGQNNCIGTTKHDVKKLFESDPECQSIYIGAYKKPESVEQHGDDMGFTMSFPATLDERENAPHVPHAAAPHLPIPMYAPIPMPALAPPILARAAGDDMNMLIDPVPHFVPISRSAGLPVQAPMVRSISCMPPSRDDDDLKQQPKRRQPSFLRPSPMMRSVTTPVTPATMVFNQLHRELSCGHNDMPSKCRLSFDSSSLPNISEKPKPPPSKED